MTSMVKEGWIKDSIGSLLNTVTGNTPLKSNKDNYGHYVGFVKPPELKDSFIGKTLDNLSQSGANSARVIPINSILISCIGNLGKVGINSEPVAFNQQINAIKPDDKVMPMFMFYQALSECFKNQLEELASGTTVPIVNKSKFNSIKIVLPPINEQKRIVAILDQAFAEIEKARANAEQNLKNARELFESYLQQVFSQRGDGWVEKSLGDLCIIKPPKKEVKQILNDDDLVSFVPMNSLGIRNKHLNLKQERKLSEVNGSYTYFANDDVLLAKITPCFENGKLGLARNLKNGVGFGSSEYIVFRCLEKLHPDFLYHYLSRQLFRDLGKLRMSGAVGHKRVAKDFIATHTIYIPHNIEKQKSIVKYIERLTSKIDVLEENYQQKIDSLDELKKSILQKAFTGNLTK